MSEMLMTGYELSNSQKTIWHTKAANGFVANNQITLSLKGAVDAGRLEQAVATCLETFEILRTDFQEVASSLKFPFQQVEELVSDRVMKQEDLSALSQQAQGEKLKEISASLKNAALNSPSFTLLKTADKAHLLLLTVPALQADSASLFLIAESVFQAYHVNLESEEVIQFNEYSSWHNQMLSEVETDSSIWENRIEQLNQQQPLSLQSKASKKSEVPGKRTHKISDSQVKAIRSFCQQGGYEMESFLLSVWNLVIYRYLGSPENYTMGVNVHGRSLEEFEGIIGPMERRLPLSVSAKPTDTFDYFYKQVYKERMLLEDEQDSFRDVEAVFPVSFGTVNEKQLTTNTFTVQTEEVNLASGYSALNLTVLNEEEGNTELQLYYDEACLNEQAMQCIENQLIATIDLVLKNPSAPLTELSLASDYDKELVKETFNDTDVNFSDRRTLLEAITHFAKYTPEKIAVKDASDSLSYRELDEKSSLFAKVLINKFYISPGDIVAQKLLRNTDMLVSLLGILKAGATFLPLDTQIPQKRMEWILQSSQARLLVTEELMPLDIEQFSKDTFQEELRKIYPLSTLPVRDENDISYVLYTSGTTGKPKGVAIPDRAFNNYIQWVLEFGELSASDKSMVFSSIAFDLNYTSLWPVLATGGALYLHEENQVFDPDQLLTSLLEEGTTYIKLTPSHFNLLINSPRFATLADQLKLNLIFLGGERISTNDIRQFLQHKPGVTFINHFGPTETTVGVVARKILPEQLEVFASKPTIGRAIANNKVMVVDSQNRELPIGVTGELAVQGANLANGYLNNEAETAEKFIANSEKEGEKLYKTGDLGRWLPNGELEFLGRKDFQVKIRGFRIELGEVESALRELPDVREVYVCTDGQEREEDKLIAFITGNNEGSETELQEALSDYLPAYMVPSSIRKVQQIPLLPNGKVNHQMLMKNKELQSTSEKVIELPKTNTEKRIAPYWQDVLDLEQVSVTEKFFNLGGNSFKLVKVFRKLSKEFPGKLTLTDLFKHNNIRDLAQFIDQQENGESSEKEDFGFEV